MKEKNKWAPPVIRINGRYANFFKVGHNAFEFVIDFGQIYHGEGDRAKFHTRIITNPFHAKAFLEALLNSIDQYQRAFGTIVEDDGENGR